MKIQNLFIMLCILALSFTLASCGGDDTGGPDGDTNIIDGDDDDDNDVIDDDDDNNDTGGDDDDDNDVVDDDDDNNDTGGDDDDDNDTTVVDSIENYMWMEGTWDCTEATGGANCSSWQNLQVEVTDWDEEKGATFEGFDPFNFLYAKINNTGETIIHDNNETPENMTISGEAIEAENKVVIHQTVDENTISITYQQR